MMEVSFISKKVMTNDDLVNENIRFKEVLVIGPKGEQLGVMMRREAKSEGSKAESARDGSQANASVSGH